jgi:hypothetical protein
MAAAVGLNAEQLRTLITKVSGASKQTEQARQLVQTVLARTWWEGADATQFKTAWQSHTNPELTRLITNYEQRITELKRQLEDQLRTGAAGEEMSYYPLLLLPGSALGASEVPGCPDGSGSEASDNDDEGSPNLPKDPEAVRDYLLNEVASLTDDPDRADEVIRGLTKAELIIIQDLLKHGLTAEQAKQLLQGGQIEIDTGNLFDKWIHDTHGQSKVREWVKEDHIWKVPYPNPGVPNTHHPDGSAYEVDGTGNMLFWEKNGKTRIQLEGHGTSTFDTNSVRIPGTDKSVPVPAPEAASHLFDLGDYKRTGLSKGPVGHDTHGDRNPIRLH